METKEARYLSCAETATLVRAELKRAFPNMKFSVRSDVYSGGASIRVAWTDGPVTRSVEEVVKRFEGATFDGMTDCKSYHASEWNGERVRFGANFVFCTREASAELRAQAEREIAARSDSQHFDPACYYMLDVRDRRLEGSYCQTSGDDLAYRLALALPGNPTR